MARLGTDELMEVAARAFAVRCSQDAVLATVGAELERREDWRASGATSLGSWLVQQLGVSDGHGSGLCRGGLARERPPAPGRRALRGSPQPRQGAVGGRGGHAPRPRPSGPRRPGRCRFKDLGALVRAEALPTPASDRAEEEAALAALQRRPGAPSWPSCPRSPTPRCGPCSRPGSRRWARTARRPSTSAGPTPWSRPWSARRASGSSRVPLVVAHVPFEVLARPDVDAARRTRTRRAHQRRRGAAPGL